VAVGSNSLAGDPLHRFLLLNKLVLMVSQLSVPFGLTFGAKTQVSTLDSLLLQPGKLWAVAAHFWLTLRPWVETRVVFLRPLLPLPPFSCPPPLSLSLPFPLSSFFDGSIRDHPPSLDPHPTQGFNLYEFSPVQISLSHTHCQSLGLISEAPTRRKTPSIYRPGRLTCYFLRMPTKYRCTCLRGIL
jgi:hypothetical protein